MKNTCVCKNGVPHINDKCLQNNKNSCSSCNPGFNLNNKDECIPYQGKCDFGVLLKQELRTKDNHCSKCSFDPW